MFLFKQNRQLYELIKSSTNSRSTKRLPNILKLKKEIFGDLIRLLFKNLINQLRVERKSTRLTHDIKVVSAVSAMYRSLCWEHLKFFYEKKYLDFWDKSDIFNQLPFCILPTLIDRVIDFDLEHFDFDSNLRFEHDVK